MVIIGANPSCTRAVSEPEEPRTIRSGSFTLRWALALIDVLVIYAALVGAYEFRFHSGWVPIFAPIPPRLVYFQASAVVAVFWFLVLVHAGLYREESSGGAEAAVLLVKGLFEGSILTLAIAFLYRGFSFSRVTVFLGVVLTGILLTVTHLMKTLIWHRLWRRGQGVRRGILVGEGELASSFFEAFRTSGIRNLHLIGTVTDDGDQAVEGLPHVGSQERLNEVIRDYFIDQVIIALPSERSDDILRVVDQVSETSASVTLIPDLYSIMATSIEPTDLGGVPAVNLGRLSIHGVAGQLKHAFDTLVAVVLVILLSPLMLLIALLIKRSSPGSVFYVQERVGLDGRSFQMYKFRSMYEDAEVKTGPVWATPGDPRCTPFGAFMRRYSLDELPQLFNVLKGEMSLVGPRPERPKFVDEFKNSVPKYVSRHRVRSGMTGWAQISGLRGQAPIEERTRFDIWYIENWSLLLDLRIILKTIRVVLFDPTGY